MTGPPTGAPRLRLAVLVEDPEGRERDGTLWQLHELALGLAVHGIDLMLVTGAAAPGPGAGEPAGGLPVVRVGRPAPPAGTGWRAAWPLAGFMTALLGWLVRERDAYDAVVVLAGETLLLPALLARRRTGRPVLLQVGHPSLPDRKPGPDPLPPTRLQGLVAAAGRIAWKPERLLRQADRCLAASPEAVAWLTAAGVPEARIVAVPRAVDTARFRPARPAERPALRDRLRLPHDRPVILLASGPRRTDAMADLLDAWSEVVRDGEPALLVLADGAGQDGADHAPMLRDRLRRPPLVGTVRLPQAGAEPELWLRATDLAVFLGPNERPFASVAEALAAGVPAVSTSCTPAAELLADGRAGRLVPAAGGAALASALAGLLARQESWSAMGEAGRALVLARHGREAVSERFAALLADTVRPSRPTGDG